LSRDENDQVEDLAIRRLMTHDANQRAAAEALGFEVIVPQKFDHKFIKCALKTVHPEVVDKTTTTRHGFREWALKSATLSGSSRRDGPPAAREVVGLPGADSGARCGIEIPSKSNSTDNKIGMHGRWRGTPVGGGWPGSVSACSATPRETLPFPWGGRIMAKGFVGYAKRTVGPVTAPAARMATASSLAGP
jgi:hypothetical protein